MLTKPSMPPNSSDDERHVDAVDPHLQKKLENPHRGSDEQQLAHDGLDARIVFPTSEQILDVDHSDHVVQSPAIYRQPRMTAPVHKLRHLRQGSLDVHGDNVRARHHDVFDRDVPDAQNVAEQRQFLGILVRVFLLDQFLDRVANAVPAVSAAAQCPQPHAHSGLAVSFAVAP